MLRLGSEGFSSLIEGENTSIPAVLRPAAVLFQLGIEVFDFVRNWTSLVRRLWHQPVFKEVRPPVRRPINRGRMQ